MKKGFTLIELIVTIAIIAVVMGILHGLYDWGKHVGRKEVRVEAVKEGVASWVVTNAVGDTEFRWMKPEPVKGEPVKVEQIKVPPIPMLPGTFSPNCIVTNDCFLLRLRDEKTGKDIDVLMPVYTGGVTLLSGESR